MKDTSGYIYGGSSYAGMTAASGPGVLMSSTWYATSTHIIKALSYTVDSSLMGI